MSRPKGITPKQYVSKAGVVTWKVQFRLNGRSTSETLANYESAEKFALLITQLGPERARAALQARKTTESGTHTVESWCRYHIGALSGVQPDTITRYEGYVRNDLGALADLPLDVVTHEDVAAWVNDLAKTDLKTKRPKNSGKTIKNKHGFLSSAFARAETKGLVPSNPCKGTTLPRTEVEPMVFLTHDEYVRFLGCFTPFWQPLVATLFSTGLRWSEATALRVGDVDLEHGVIMITRAWKRGGEIGPPKSRKSRRPVSIAPETVEVLRPLVEGRPADAWVFRNAYGGPVRHATFHDNAWTPAVRLANGEPAQKAGAKRVARRRDAEGNLIAPLDPPLGKRPRIHDARHTCASWLLRAYVPISYVQAHLGHESITTTVDRYGHVMPDAQAAIAGALSTALSAAHPQIEA